jgi:hypothetical protein
MKSSTYIRGMKAFACCCIFIAVAASTAAEPYVTDRANHLVQRVVLKHQQQLRLQQG